MAQRVAFQSWTTRRWMIIAAATALLGFSHFTTGVPSLALIGAFTVISSALNLFVWLISRTGTFHLSFAIAAFLLDLAIATAPVVAMGAGGFLVGLIVVIVPYTLHSSRMMSGFHIASGGVFYIAAVGLHGVYVTLPARHWTDIPVQVLGEVALFIVVAVALRTTGTRVSARLRAIRSMIPGADHTTSSVGSGDEVAVLEYSLRELRIRTETAVAALSGEARTVNEFADLVRASAERANEAHATLVLSSSTTADGLEIQRRGAEAGERRSATASEYARELGEKATTVSSEVEALLQLADAARKQIQRSHEALNAIEHDVGGTVDAVATLNKTVTTMNDTLQDILGSARQTHVLALNTAIKSANGGISEQASSDMATRFRALAGDTSGSARGAAQLVDEMQEYIATADRAMRAGQTRARDAVMFTEATAQILNELHRVALRSNEMTGASVDVTRIQTEHLNELSKHLADAAANRVDTTEHVASAADAVSLHKAAMDELESAGALLSAVAARMQHQFSTLVMRQDVSSEAGTDGDTDTLS